MALTGHHSDAKIMFGRFSDTSQIIMILDSEDHFYSPEELLPKTNDRSQHLFIVRMWQEVGSRKADQWRGSVEHVPSAQRLYFASLGDLNDFITLRLNSKPTQGDGPVGND